MGRGLTGCGDDSSGFAVRFVARQVGLRMLGIGLSRSSNLRTFGLHRLSEY